MRFKSIADAIDGQIPDATGRRATYLRMQDVVRDYSGFAKLIPRPTDQEWEVRAEVRFPYNPESVRLIKTCKGAHFDGTLRAWIVPGYSAKRLSEVLYAISIRSRD